MVTIVTMPIIHVVNVLISAVVNSQEHLECQGSRLLCVCGTEFVYHLVKGNVTV